MVSSALGIPITNSRIYVDTLYRQLVLSGLRCTLSFMLCRDVICFSKNKRVLLELIKVLDRVNFAKNYQSPPTSQFIWFGYAHSRGTSGSWSELINSNRSRSKSHTKKRLARVAFALLLAVRVKLFSSNLSSYFYLVFNISINQLKGLAMPFMANIVGKVFYPTQSPFKRWLLGCGTYLMAKGGLTLVRKYKLRRWNRARQVKDFEGRFFLRFKKFDLFSSSRRRRGHREWGNSGDARNFDWMEWRKYSWFSMVKIRCFLDKFD